MPRATIMARWLPFVTSHRQIFGSCGRNLRADCRMILCIQTGIDPGAALSGKLSAHGAWRMVARPGCNVEGVGTSAHWEWFTRSLAFAEIVFAGLRLA